MTSSPMSAAAVGPCPRPAAAVPRPWVFTATDPAAIADCWCRADLVRQEAHDPITAALLWLIFKGSGVPFTVTREDQT